jgi:hypothetical protein
MKFRTSSFCLSVVKRRQLSSGGLLNDTVGQGYPDFPDTWDPPQNFRREMDDIKKSTY